MEYGGVRLRYVISGGAGFIGSHMCEYLLDKGHSVLALDNLITGSTGNIDHLLSNGKFEFRQVDVTRPPSADPWMP
jgi:nucleoside-diphosphate-sugar epimerase